MNRAVFIKAGLRLVVANLVLSKSLTSLANQIFANRLVRTTHVLILKTLGIILFEILYFDPICKSPKLKLG